MLYHDDITFVIFTVRQRSCRKEMFSVVCLSVYLFTREVPCDHYPWYIGPHCTGPPDIEPHCTGPPSSAIWWQRLETCSNLFTWGSPLHSWHLVATVRILLECFLDKFDFCSCWRIIHTQRNSTWFYSKRYRSVIEPMMGDEPILSIIQPVTFDTMLNNNWLNNGSIFLS